MASIERLVKAFEALKVIQTPIDRPEEALVSTRFIKRETSLAKKDKTLHCNTIADIICCPSLRNIEDFQKFLGITIETFLACCDDPDSDVRMTANECLNRTIKNLMDSQLSRIQVELYKEIKKNGSSRSLRAALSRFADLSHLTRPVKCRPYVLNLFPSLVKISERTEEDLIQETLQTAMTKIMPVLAPFASDNEIISLLNAFLPNLQFVMPSVRRTAASSLVVICQYSRKPQIFFSWLLTHLLQSLNQLNAIPETNDASLESQTSERVLIGIFLCIKQMIPHLYDIPSHIEYESLNTFGVTQKQREQMAKEYDTITENLLQMFELILYNIRYNNNNSVIVAALEALRQLLTTPPKLILPYLTDPKGIDKSRIGTFIQSSPASPMLSLHRSNRRMQSTNSLSCSSINVESLADEEFVNICGVTSLEDQLDQSLSFTDTGFQQFIVSEQRTKSDTFNGSDIITDSEDSQINLEMNRIDNERKMLAESEAESVRQSQQTSGFQLTTKLTFVDTEDNNEDQISPSNTDVSLDAVEERFNVSMFDIKLKLNHFVPKFGEIGDFLTENISCLEYCSRLLCSQFLLAGTSSQLISDRLVRVSVKAIALGSMAAIMRLQPKALIIELFIENDTTSTKTGESSQKLWDILQYCTHSDPQVRGQVAMTIGNFINAVLNENTNFNDFLLQNCSVSTFPECPTLDELLNKLSTIINDNQRTSSMAIKHGLNALKLCLKSCLGSNDSVNLNAFALIESLIKLKDNSYWLIKTELLELFSQIDYKNVHFFETLKSQLKNGINIKRESIQNRILNEVFYPLIADSDFRVREAAAEALCSLVPMLFTPIIQCDSDPINAITLEQTINNMAEADTSAKDYESSVPPLRSFINHINAEPNVSKVDHLIGANLSTVISDLFRHFQFNLDDKHFLVGYCNAFALLSKKYPITEFSECWGCDGYESSIATQLTKICITLLTTNPITMLDLSTHQNVLTLTGSLLEGLAYSLIKSNFSSNTTDYIDLEWGLISHINPSLAQILDNFFTHSLRILNIYCSILEEPVIAPNLMSSITNYNKMPVIQSLSNSPLSPIKKKPSQKSSDFIDKNDKKTDPEKADKDKFTKIGSSALLVRFSDLIRSSYLSNKTTFDLKPDKMLTLMNATLNSLGRILEFPTIKYISKYVEEVLYYLRLLFSLEPCLSVKNVRQLLKCIFGTNFVVLFATEPKVQEEVVEEEEEIAQKDNSASNKSLINSSTTSEVVGLYETCLSSPYTKFTQFYATMSSRRPSTFGSNDETDLTFSSWLRKKIEKRVASILDKGTSSGLTSANISTKTSLTSHIRLFEPVVIKALKQYTTTSDIGFQCEVLDLLSQLVQLRVNYCLLDSEQIFIGFVLKQFDFIENGHFDRYDQLIGHIFFFLILLSYEKYHSKTIIGIPKIIQLCDGILASGHYPHKFALPSLQPIVEDLILLRNPSKVESSKELEAQREVIIANCLKLVQFPRILRILVIVTKQSKREGEEKWKKISRQITDILLPQLVKQSIQIDSYEALNLLHQLFESVSPNVFRPVDILLKALFAAPQPDITDNYYYFHRWTSLILVILRLLIVQVKEEVVLARLEEIKSSIVTIGPFGLPVIPTSSFLSNNSIPFHMSSIANRNDSLTLESEEMFAEYLLQILQLCSNEYIVRSKSIYEDIRSHSEFLCQQMANYMLILTHMFQSGSFRRVAKAAMNIIKKNQFNDMPENLTLDCESYLNGFSLQKTNASFLNIQSKSPTLALQWFNLLMLLNYEESLENGLWDHLIRPDAIAVFSTNSKVYLNTKRRGSISKSKNVAFYSPSVEIMRRGALILFCDFVCENLNDAEHMTWLIVYNINEIIKLCHESPVTEFISAIHRNSASSGLFIQAINARCDDNLKTPSFLRRLLTCLERVHPSQSVSLITFLIEKILANPCLQSNYLLLSDAEKLTIKRLNLLSSSVDSYSNQTANHLSTQDLDKFIVCLNQHRNAKVVAILESHRTDPLDANASQTSHPLVDSTSLVHIPEMNKEWFLDILSKYCKKYTKGHKAAHLLNRLSYDDIVAIVSSKDFALEILGDCIEFGDHSLVEEDKVNTKIMFSVVMNRINLLKASLNAVLHHIGYFISILPSPHFPFLSHSEMITPKEARHRDKLIEFFSQNNLWQYLFKLSLGFLSFLEHHSERSIASDLLPNIARISVLYSESIQYMTEAVENISFSHLIVSLNIMRSALTSNSIFTFLSLPENISYQCSIISSIHSLAKLFFHELPKFEEPDNFARAEKENPEWKHPHKACVRLAQLVCLLESETFGQSGAVPPTVHSLIKKVILLTARLPLVNSFVMVPISVWTIKNESAWNPSFTGDFGTVVPTIPSEFLHFKEILDQFCFRVMSLGWTCRVQFEEIWMSLLGVLGANSAYVEPNDELSERINVCMATTEAISLLLLLSSLSPQPGNPIKSKFVKQKSEKIPSFLHSTHGVKLQLVREPLLTAINSLSLNDTEIEPNSYDFGQISVEILRLPIRTVNSNELSPSLSSTSSSSDYSPLSPSNANKSISSNQDKSEIDLNSCLHFLLDLYGQLLSAQQTIQLPLLTEICKSTVLLSDLFTERTQFEWLLDTFLEMHRMAQISEDEIISQYLIVGICKASAVLGLETEQVIEKCKKCIESSLKSHYLPTRISTLHGLSYLLEFRGLGTNGKETVFLPIASDYLLKHLSDTSLPSSNNTEHVELMWKLAFHLIEFFVDDYNESEFAQKIFQLSIKVLTDKYSKVYHLVAKNLEHLILCEKFSIKESNLIVKSGLDRFKTANCQLDALLAFNLILTATYFVGSVGLDLEKDMDDSEEFLLAMEKLSVIFERLKTCHNFEAQQICNVLPHFLCTFFPTQDILNKCIGEFLSGQQTHSKHLANILFVVFNRLQTESRLDIVHDWVLLSLSSFTQLNPMSSAIWSLTSFLISASVNSWIRCSFPYLLTRFGLLEESDRQLFFIVCHNFYNELKSEQNREAFRTTFQSISSSPDSPYCEVLRYLQIAKIP